jgi:hypothetical protein
MPPRLRVLGTLPDRAVRPIVSVRDALADRRERCFDRSARQERLGARRQMAVMRQPVSPASASTQWKRP